MYSIVESIVRVELFDMKSKYSIINIGNLLQHYELAEPCDESIASVVSTFFETLFHSRFLKLSKKLRIIIMKDYLINHFPKLKASERVRVIQLICRAFYQW